MWCTALRLRLIINSAPFVVPKCRKVLNSVLLLVGRRLVDGLLNIQTMLNNRDFNRAVRCRCRNLLDDSAGASCLSVRQLRLRLAKASICLSKLRVTCRVVRCPLIDRPGARCMLGVPVRLSLLRVMCRLWVL